jgi:hypothetical protein
MFEKLKTIFYEDSIFFRNNPVIIGQDNSNVPNVIKGTPPLLDDFHHSKTTSPIESKFLPQIDYLK